MLATVYIYIYRYNYVYKYVQYTSYIYSLYINYVCMFNMWKWWSKCYNVINSFRLLWHTAYYYYTAYFQYNALDKKILSIERVSIYLNAIT